MTKAIEARRELLATATHVSDRYENECGPEADEDLAAMAMEVAVATKEYLLGEDAQALCPIVQLSPDHPLVHAKEADYDHWIGFVCQKIDRACGFEVDVKARPWGDIGPVRVLADDARADRVYEAILTLRDEFLSLDSPVVVRITADPPQGAVRAHIDGDTLILDRTDPYEGPVVIGCGHSACVQHYIDTGDASCVMTGDEP